MEMKEESNTQTKAMLPRNLLEPIFHCGYSSFSPEHQPWTKLVELCYNLTFEKNLLFL
jgi:hypothetical protein